MKITIEIPDQLAEQLANGDQSQLPRRVLEILTVEAYKTERITSAEVGRILGFSINPSVHIEQLGQVEEELAQAQLCKTRLPAGINLDLDRDCKD